MTRRLLGIWVAWLIVAGIAAAGLPSEADAADDKPSWVGRAVSVQGRVFVRRQGTSTWQPVSLEDTFFAGDQIRVGENSRAAVVLSNDAFVRLDQDSSLVFSAIEQESTFLLRLIRGAANFFSHRPRSLRFLTPFVNGVVEGTEFYVRVDDTRTRIDLFEGRILAENRYGALSLTKGEGAVASAGSAPQRQLLVRPRDSVQWALYYPPILSAGEGEKSAAIDASLRLYDQGRTADAFARLEAVPVQSRDAAFFVYRAALRLHVGRVADAEADLGRALTLDPQNSDALALKAIVAVVQNRSAEAVDLARRAVAVPSPTTAAWIALSYALQSAFRLDDALAAARDAVKQAPDSGLAWARLAELRLSQGELDAGVAAARRASKLNPDMAHAHTILGFADLTRMDTAGARTAFLRAIALDSAAPLPRLGLGLADIRDGDLAKGRAQIEIAVGLDPDNALMRSYLGKAYFDEKREPRDERQFAIAKELDPNDPTPWFYDAIRKQTLNRPVEALDDLQHAIALNDDRAVYRSRLLLDEDLAARSASLARIYNDLGFEQRALVEGYTSVNTDPANYSGHRFLSDAYLALPRHGIARVSELLQSQLLQPLSVNPVQPQLAESDLPTLVISGPAQPAFNEFNPLFERDRLTLQASGVVGSHAIRGDELTQSGLWRNFSYSLGQFHYETDGFRENSDLSNDTYNAFVQTALTPALSLQGEYRYQESESGDLDLRFNPADYSPNERNRSRRRTARFGARYSPAVQHDFIASVIHSRNVDRLHDDSQEELPGVSLELDFDGRRLDEAYSAELQYLRQSDRFDLTAGAGYVDVDLTNDGTTTSTTSITFPFPLTTTRVTAASSDIHTEHTNAYLYSNLRIFENLVGVLGASVDSFRRLDTDQESINPKAGLIWEATPSTTLRAAAFRTVKRPFAADQTVEPTQVAGFNQFFDDLDGSKTRRYGVALDQRFSPQLLGGVEFTWREIEMPIIVETTDPSGTIIRYSDTDYQDEQFHRAYLYRTLGDRVSLSAEYQYEKFERDLTANTDPNAPKNITTHRLPLGANFFDPAGAFVKLKATYIDQTVDSPAGGESSGRDRFWVADVEIGFRLPGRRGVVSAGVRNLFDQAFRYQDVNLQTGEPLTPEFLPTAVSYVQATLSF